MSLGCTTSYIILLITISMVFFLRRDNFYGLVYCILVILAYTCASSIYMILYVQLYLFYLLVGFF
jgi:hypothetical protein